MESAQFNDNPYADDGIPAEEIREQIRQSLSVRQDFVDHRWGGNLEERAAAGRWSDSGIADPIRDLRPPRAEKRCDGLSSGFSDIDRIIGGLHKGEILTVAGLTSSCVSTLLQNVVRRVAVTAAHNGIRHDSVVPENCIPARPTMYCSLDTARRQVVTRLLAAEAKIPLRFSAGRNISADSRLAEASARLTIADIQIFDSYGISVRALASEVRSFLPWKSLNLLAIDGIDSLEINSLGEQRPIAETMSVLQATARELGVPIILSCRIDPSRVDDGAMRPRFQSLPPAVQLYSDVVAILHRPDHWMPSQFVEDEYQRSLSGSPIVQKGIEVLELEVVRQPDGTRDSARLAFRDSIGRIDDITWD